MRIFVLVVAVLVLGSCASLVDPDSAGADRTYHLVYCASPASAIPCTIEGSASTQQKEDSARIVLKRDHTLTWVTGTTTTLNTCYLTGPPCPVTTVGVDSRVGTYTFTGNTVIVHLSTPPGAGVETLTAAIPTKVAAAWPGPDSLRYDAYVGANRVVLTFKP